MLNRADAELPDPAGNAISRFVGHGPGKVDRLRDDPHATDWDGVGFMSAEALEDAYSQPPTREGALIRQQLEQHFAPIRAMLAQAYGTHITLYRAQEKVEPGSRVVGFKENGLRHVLSWTAMPKVADSFAGIYRKDDHVHSEEVIQQKEREYAENGIVQVSKSTYLKRSDHAGKPYTGFFMGKEVVDMPFPDYPEIWTNGDMVTDCGSVREYLESENRWANEHNTENAKKRERVFKADIPLEDVVWVTDRAGQWEFIVANYKGTPGYIDPTGKKA